MSLNSVHHFVGHIIFSSKLSQSLGFLLDDFAVFVVNEQSIYEKTDDVRVYQNTQNHKHGGDVHFYNVAVSIDVTKTHGCDCLDAPV